jgi:hypothetical protein
MYGSSNSNSSSSSSSERFERVKHKMGMLAARSSTLTRVGGALKHSSVFDKGSGLPRMDLLKFSIGGPGPATSATLNSQTVAREPAARPWRRRDPSSLQRDTTQ